MAKIPAKNVQRVKKQEKARIKAQPQESKPQEKQKAKKEIVRVWHLMSAKNKILGRLATEVARILQGKNKAIWLPNQDMGDYVVVTDACEIVVTGHKEEQKLYSRYSGYPGGLKQKTLGKMRQDNPTEIIRHAVMGMMPKTKLARQMMKKLYVFAGSDLPKDIEARITNNS